MVITSVLEAGHMKLTKVEHTLRAGSQHQFRLPVQMIISSDYPFRLSVQTIEMGEDE